MMLSINTILDQIHLEIGFIYEKLGQHGTACVNNLWLGRTKATNLNTDRPKVRGTQRMWSRILFSYSTRKIFLTCSTTFGG
jgi:hypothetical protein